MGMGSAGGGAATVPLRTKGGVRDYMTCGLYSWTGSLSSTYGFHLLVLIFTGHHILKGFVGGGGSGGIVGAGMEYHFRDHKVSGSSLQIYQSVASLPWSIKAIMGLVSDSFPMYGRYYKAPYVAFTTMVACGCYLFVGSHFVSVQISTICFFFAFFQMSLADLMIEAKYAEQVKKHPEKGPDLISFVWGGMSLWTLLSTVIVGYLIENLGADSCFLFALPFAALILLPTLGDYFEEGAEYDEQRLREQQEHEEQMEAYAEQQPTIESETTRLADSGAASQASDYKAADTASAAVALQRTSPQLPLNSASSSPEDNTALVVPGGGSAGARPPSSLVRSEPEGENAIASQRTSTSSVKNSQHLLQIEENRPIFYLAIFMGISGITTAAFSVLVTSKILNFIVAYGLGLTVLFGFSVFLRPIVAKMNAFFFIQNVLAVSVHGAAFYFFTDTPEQYPDGPHFEPHFYISVIGIVASVFSLIGMTTYNMYAKEWNYQTILMYSNIVAMFLQLVNCIVFLRWNVKMGIPDSYFMVCSTGITSAVFQFGWMPGTVMLAQMVPRGLESTMYALLAGSFNMSTMMSNYSGALLLELLNCRPNGSKNEGKEFEYLWVGALVGSALPCVTLFAIPYLIPNAKQTEKLLVENPESPTIGSVYSRYLKGRYGRLVDDPSSAPPGGGGAEVLVVNRGEQEENHRVVSPVLGRQRSPVAAGENAV
ncbi:unnamed protein product [Amoebophrya sp. A120]|nr:unnamed protein product [Amoebophrya sp. A120]|eukprot:GSA120T00021433001.1